MSFNSCSMKVLTTCTHSHIHRGEAAAMFKHHTKPVTSVEWHPQDSTVFASAGEDNQVVSVRVIIFFLVDCLQYCNCLSL